MFSLLENEGIEPKNINPLLLAYIGDSVFDLMVKQKMLISGEVNLKSIHKKTVAVVCCTSQSAYMERLMPILTEEEMEFYKRGRNANISHVPKQASPIEYKRATGFEALIGYLYLSKKTERLSEIFNIILECEV